MLMPGNDPRGDSRYAPHGRHNLVPTSHFSQGAMIYMDGGPVWRMV